MNEAKIIAILIHPSSNLDKDKEGKTIIELCACFQNSSRKSYLSIVKRIFRYLVGIAFGIAKFYFLII